MEENNQFFLTSSLIFTLSSVSSIRGDSTSHPFVTVPLVEFSISSLLVLLAMSEFTSLPSVPLVSMFTSPLLNAASLGIS